MTTPAGINDVIDMFVEDRLSDLHTCMPAEVLKVHDGPHKRQFVDVLPTLQREVEDEDGELINEAYPVVTMVPVGFARGGGFFVSFPLAVGDIVLLVFAERSLDMWLETARAGTQRQIIPGDVGLHVLEGAVALPVGPGPRANLLADVHAENLVIGRDGGAQIHVTPDGKVLLGSGSASDYVALASLVSDQLTALKTAVDNASATEAGASGLGGMTALKAELETALWPAGVAATKVKAE